MGGPPCGEWFARRAIIMVSNDAEAVDVMLSVSHELLLLFDI